MKFYALWGSKGFAIVSNWNDAKEVLLNLGSCSNSKKFKELDEASNCAYQMYLSCCMNDYTIQEVKSDNANTDSFSDGYYHVIVSKAGFGVYYDLLKMDGNSKYFGKNAIEKQYKSEEAAKKWAKKKCNEILDSFDYDTGYFDADISEIEINKHYFRKQLSEI